MRLNSRSSWIALAVALTFLVQATGAPGVAVAGYVDRSDELPGTDNNVAPYLVVGGLVVAGFVVYKLATKKSGGDKDAGKTPAEPEATGEAQDDATDQASSTGGGLKLLMGVDPDVSRGRTDGGNWGLSDVEFKVGLSLGF
jgi:hypothetical protein